MKWLFFILGILLFIGYLSRQITEVYYYIVPALLIMVSMILQIVEKRNK